ncbi:bifunctional phosphoglucose/phosphomannose isomerase [Candidatus Bipolaricaulota bacterium]|nr:bifunctional phosphoglucose/phosphomannose isomerase [Candidatus Bipolaricaulota bacterium]
MSVYAVIMAGGKGERLWPASTPARPKPFLPLAEGKTLIQATYDRVVPLTGRARMYVIAERRLAEPIRVLLGLPPEQVLTEPQGRNTAPAIGLAALVLALQDPEAIMMVLPADHLIGDEEEFRNTLSLGVEAARAGYLVTLGIEPTYPATGYGYIQRGEPLPEFPQRAFRVRRFTEKPDGATAEGFLSEGGYYWNAGIFLWRAARILEEIDRFLPRLSAALQRLRPLWGSAAWEGTLREVWDQVEEISIDYGVMERAERVAVIPASFDWHDLGDWQGVWEVLPKDERGLAAQGEHLAEDTGRTLVWGLPGKPVATLGVSGLAIVDTPEALLVADLARTQEVRALARRARKTPPDWKELYQLDPSGMLEEVKKFPAQCREALALGKAAELPLDKLSGFSRVLCVGMGGSGITGDLLARLLPLEVIPCRGYRVPEFIGEETLLLAVSYSGNTEETLSAFRDGLSKTPRALAISSGGKLRELAEERGVPWIGIPGGHQPRAALGYLLFTLLSAFRRLGTFNADLEPVLEVLEALSRKLAPAAAGNRAQELARALHGRVPLICGVHGNTAPVAFRWKTQINENAKQPAFWAELPELCHNEIVGYELTERVLPTSQVVFLRTDSDHPRVAARIEILREVLARRGLAYLEVEAEGEDEFSQLFSLLYLGDWVSVYLALLNRVDPTPVRPIQELKDRLARYKGG